MKNFGIVVVCWIVFVALVAGCKPVLTQSNADKLIPNGMSESQVRELLGTNATVSFGQDGEKYLFYWFFFTGSPPKVKTELKTPITIVISNEVVVDKRFSSQ